MKSTVISLLRSHERRDRVARAFDAVGLPFAFLDALDARDLTAEHYATLDSRYRRRRGMAPLSPPELACSLSHRAALRSLAAASAPMGAIYEDDAKPLPELPAVLQALEGREGSFDAVVLGRRQPWKPLVDPVPLAGERRMGRIRYNEWGAEGYVITRSAARFLLERCARVRFPFDVDLCHVWVNRLNLFFLDEPVVHHDDRGFSYLQAGRQRSLKANRRLQLARLRRVCFRIEMAALKRRTFPRLRDGRITTKT